MCWMMLFYVVTWCTCSIQTDIGIVLNGTVSLNSCLHIVAIYSHVGLGPGRAPFPFCSCCSIYYTSTLLRLLLHRHYTRISRLAQMSPVDDLSSPADVGRAASAAGPAVAGDRQPLPVACAVVEARSCIVVQAKLEDRNPASVDADLSVFVASLSCWGFQQ